MVKVNPSWTSVAELAIQARDFAAHFDNALGLDSSATSIHVARSTGRIARKGSIQYTNGDLGALDAIPNNSVDLILVATMITHTEMEEFWPQASRVLKSKGSVTFLNFHRSHCHLTAPHAEEVQRLFSELERNLCKPCTFSEIFATVVIPRPCCGRGTFQALAMSSIRIFSPTVHVPRMAVLSLMELFILEFAASQSMKQSDLLALARSRPLASLMLK